MDKLYNYTQFIKEEYNPFQSELTFKRETEEDRLNIFAYINDVRIGTMNIEYIFDGYYMFEDYMSEETFDELFPDSMGFAKIESITIENKYQGNGYAKALMVEGINEIKSEGYKSIYLNASPMGYGGLNVKDLTHFYEKMGFTIFNDEYVANKEMILTLEGVRGMESNLRTIDYSIMDFDKKFKDKRKKEVIRQKEEEEKTRDDIIIDEYDKDTPLSDIQKDPSDKTRDPSALKSNSMTRGSTNMP